MKRLFRLLLKILKWAGIVLLGILVIFLIVRFIGKRINSKTPDGGINETFYADINGTQQWISIYGQNTDNPVLLYLHGGPGEATSFFDYAFTRKWSDVYTVVTWDQRNCGKSFSKDQCDNPLTYDILMKDGEEVTKLILQHLNKEKLTILGHSWGSIYGCNLVMAHPEYYDAYIGTGQLIDFRKNEEAFKKEAAKWTEGDKEGLALLGKLQGDEFTMEYAQARNALMKRYGYDMLADGADYSIGAAVIFNPYYSIGDFAKMLIYDFTPYLNFINSDEFARFSLTGRNHYEVPFYNINGDKDYQTNHILAEEYFETVEAPYKKLYIMKGSTHGLLETRSGEFSDIIHEIASDTRS